jgi:methionyl-tRNA formyltransferase
MSGRVLLIGFGPTAASALAGLLAQVEVLGVVRGALEPEDPVAALAAARDVPLHQARSRRDVEALVLSLRPDATVISSYNRLLGPAVLEACPVFNVHYAPLPRYRGNAPVNWALLNGEAETAITVHRVSSGLDDGPILFQEKVPIGPEDNATTLFERLNAIQERELGPAVQRGLEGAPGLPQDEAQATYGCPRNPEDGEIDWQRPAADIDRLTRALAPPFPGAFTHHQGTTLIVHRVGAAATTRRYVGSIPGRVIDVSVAGGWIDVLTGGGVLRVHEMSRTGEPPRPAAEFVTSRRARLGLSGHDLLQRITDFEKRLARLEAKRTKSSGSSGIDG